LAGLPLDVISSSLGDRERLNEERYVIVTSLITSFCIVIQTDRQTDRQTNRHTGRESGRRTGRQAVV